MRRFNGVSLFLTFALALPLHAEELSLRRRSWLSTGPGNSLTAVPDQFRFNRTNVSTVSEETNIHSHYKVRRLSALRNYTFKGQMRISDGDGGIGITFHSQYNDEDRYYRLRSYPGEPNFHIAPHGDGEQMITDGVIDSGVPPAVGAWHRFKVLVRSTNSRTRIRAKVWRIGTAEPAWQIDCSDRSEIKIRRGRVGLWSMGEGEKRWRKLDVTTR